MEILSSLEGTEHGVFAFVGGFTRDYGKRPYNDLDIAAVNPDYLRTALQEMHVLKAVEHQEGDRIPHDTYFNPYVFDHTGIPVHFIHSGNENGYAPNSFDFSINEFALKSDMYVYAPTFAWRDLHSKVLRFNDNQPVTTNCIMRGVRFAAKTGFTFDKKTAERFIDYLKNAKSGRYKAGRASTLGDAEPQNRLGSNRVLLGVDKMIEDGVEEKGFELLKALNFEGVHDLQNIHELRTIHNDLILKGEAHIEHIEVY
jgi:hypothetical protein